MATAASSVTLHPGLPGKLALLGAGTGVLTVLAMTYIPNWMPWPTKIVASGGPFALLLAYGVRQAAGATMLRSAAVVLMTLLAWQCAMTAGIQAHELVNQWAPVSGSAAVKMAVAGLVGGLVGSALTLVGLAVAADAFRRWRAWASTVALGTVLGLLLAGDDAIGTRDVLFWLLFVVWQAGVAWQVARVLCQPKQR
jgi:hypothetical protein